MATHVKSCYVTCPAIMTEVCIEDVWMIRFECDTAASHSIISEKVYNSLRHQKPQRIPAVKQEKLVIRLADGTISNKACGSVSLLVKAKNSHEVKLMMISTGCCRLTFDE